MNNEHCKKSGKHFHIFSLTGGKECVNGVQENGCVTHYQFNQFKIENIDEELAKLGFNLKGKVDLIISDWTLRHLVDPFGTLKRMYSLLTPKQGMLLSNGFLFKFYDSDKIEAFPYKNENILAHTSAIPLFRHYDSGRDAGQFLLVRTDENELIIPLEYDGNVSQIPNNYQCSSAMVTVFKKGYISQRDAEYTGHESFKYYWNKNDLRSKELYFKLLERGYVYDQDHFW